MTSLECTLVVNATHRYFGWQSTKIGRKYYHTQWGEDARKKKQLIKTKGSNIVQEYSLIVSL